MAETPENVIGQLVLPIFARNGDQEIELGEVIIDVPISLSLTPPPGITPAHYGIGPVTEDCPEGCPTREHEFNIHVHSRREGKNPDTLKWWN